MRKPILIQFKKGENKHKHNPLKESWNVSFWIPWLTLFDDNAFFLFCSLIRSFCQRLSKSKSEYKIFALNLFTANQLKKFWIETSFHFVHHTLLTSVNSALPVNQANSCVYWDETAQCQFIPSLLKLPMMLIYHRS